MPDAIPGSAMYLPTVAVPKFRVTYIQVEDDGGGRCSPDRLSPPPLDRVEQIEEDVDDPEGCEEKVVHAADRHQGRAGGRVEHREEAGDVDDRHFLDEDEKEDGETRRRKKGGVGAGVPEGAGGKAPTRAREGQDDRLDNSPPGDGGAETKETTTTRGGVAAAQGLRGLPPNS